MKTFKDHAAEAQMTEADRIAHAATWDAAIASVLSLIPGGSICDPQRIADDVRALVTE